MTDFGACSGMESQRRGMCEPALTAHVTSRSKQSEPFEFVRLTIGVHQWQRGIRRGRLVQRLSGCGCGTSSYSQVRTLECRRELQAKSQRAIHSYVRNPDETRRPQNR